MRLARAVHSSAMQLVGLKGVHWGQTIPVAGSEITIGREAGNTIVCDGDSRVSRRHARITPGGLSYQVEDLGSSNGTLVNGVRIAGPTALNPGDEITIGGQSFRFENASQPAAPYGAPSPAPPQPGGRKREVSRGEQARAQPNWTPPQGRDLLSGCVLPDFNLPDASGCLKMLFYLLIACVAVLVIGGLVMLAGFGIGALGSLFGANHAGPGIHSPAGGGSTPPPANPGGAGAPP
ncbi:MAG TPA: FHA domain-containing protein, partial [Fimbriimonadaceae bacterium]|nr:FHA domain-containing protein [Fimbriimonadaceae bacterium]